MEHISRYIYRTYMSRVVVFFWIFGILLSWSCDNNVLDPKPADKDPQISALDSSLLSGTGDFSFTSYAPLANKPIQVFYHIPKDATNQTPILFAFHGAGRDGEVSRNDLVDEANALKFIVIVPQFSDEYYPNSNAYNLGNIFEDGDNPTANSLNNEEIWTFSTIEPLFDLLKVRIRSATNTYDLFGHSAGAQFVHRYLTYKPQARVNRAVCAASGWYTMLDSKITFPYGTQVSPAENETHHSLLAKRVSVIVGDKDVDENSFGLRHNSEVDRQGLNRYTRAQYYYTKTQEYAISEGATFNWQFQILPNVGHDYTATSAAAALLLYP